MKGRVIVIGTSFGGVGALLELVGALPANLPAALLVVQHTSPDGPGMLATVLSNAKTLRAGMARDREFLEPGRIYVAPPDRHLLVRPGGYLHLSHGPKENRTRPAIDPTMRSAALVYGPAAVGVVLTGYLDDGTRGLLAIKGLGGVAIVQEPREAQAPSMPLSALNFVPVDHCATLKEIAALIIELANDAPGAPGTADRTLLELEDRIADGVLPREDWLALEHHGKATGYNCPDCRSALYELGGSRPLHFRCRAGHAFSARALLAGQAQARDDMVASLFGALHEEASLARRLEETGGDGNPALADLLHDRCTRLESHAALLGDWISTAEPGLAEPA